MTQNNYLDIPNVCDEAGRAGLLLRVSDRQLTGLQVRGNSSANIKISTSFERQEMQCASAVLHTLISYKIGHTF